MTKYVLKEKIASKQQGRDVYFKKLTMIGPMNTVDILEAAQFDTPAEAQRSQAMRHSLSSYEVEELIQ